MFENKVVDALISSVVMLVEAVVTLVIVELF